MVELRFPLRRFDGHLWPAGVTPALELVPSGPGVDAWGAYGGGPVAVAVVEGEARADVAPTTSMHGRHWYTLCASWVEDRVPQHAYWPHKIRVPHSPGPVYLHDLVDADPDDLYPLLEVSRGTTDPQGRPIPHSRHATHWIRETPDGRLIWMEQST